MRIDRDRFLDQGFLVLRSLFRPEEVAELRRANEAVVERQRARWRAEAPAGGPPGGVWETHPQPRVTLDSAPGLLDRASAAAAAMWVDDRLLEVANALLCAPHAMVTELFLMCSPSFDAGPSTWHRDVNPYGMAPLGELIADVVENGPRYVQWNIPLEDDRVFWIVPGSHRRLDRGAEVGHHLRSVTTPLPEGIPVELAAGDAVVYINYLLHWGSAYNRSPVRRTVHGGHSIFTSHRHATYLDVLPSWAQDRYAQAHARTLACEDLTEAALRAAMAGDAPRFRTLLGRLQPGIGPAGQRVLTIYASKLAGRIHGQRCLGRQLPPGHDLGMRHPITLKWERIEERFSASEAVALWHRFAPIDQALRRQPSDAHPCDLARSDYAEEQVPSGAGAIDACLARWQATRADAA